MNVVAASHKLRVAVLFGGRSAEHEISLLSARFVVEALDRERFEPILIGIDKNGRWHLHDEMHVLAASRDPRLACVQAAGPEVSLAPHPAGKGDALGVEERGVGGLDVVFPVLHGPLGEDGCVQGLLELAGVAYVGAGVLGSALGMDKDVMKRVLAAAGIPVLPHTTLRRAELVRAHDATCERAELLGYPLFVKPANLGSSVGVRRAETRAELEQAIAHALSYDTKVVVEKGLSGAREIECAVLGNDDPIASIPGEIVIDHPDGFYSYAAKYIDEGGATLRIPADLTHAHAALVRRLAIDVFRALECAGMARVDFFLEGERLYVNELNTIPGFTAVSMYPKLWEASGVPARDLVTRLLDLALERAEARRSLRTSV
jgi:D-alanine-D-alanine ligase